MRSSKIALLAAPVAAALAGCPFVTSGEGNGFSGSGGATTGSGTTGSSGPTTSSASVAASSSSGKPFCPPNSTQPCYAGPPGTEDAGTCAPGVQTCAADGTSYGACLGSVTPEPDNCASKLNAHCDPLELGCLGNLAAQGGGAFGGPGDDRGLGVAIDSQGNTIVSGYFSGTVDFGNGGPAMPLTAVDNADGFVASYSQTGALNWVTPVGGMGLDQATAVALDASDDVVVVGSFATAVTFATPTPTALTGGAGIFVAKLDKTGKALWAKGFVGPATLDQHDANAVAVGSDGAIAVAGDTAGTITVGNATLTSTGGLDGLLIALDASGTVDQATLITGTAMMDQVLNGVAIAADHTITVTGAGSGDVNFGDGAVTTHGNSKNVLVARYQADGKTVTWKHVVGADNNMQAGHAVALDPAGDVFLTGNFQVQLSFGTTMITAPAGTPNNTNSMFVAELDPGGTAKWGTQFTPTMGGMDARGLGIAADTYGVVVGGYLTGKLTVGTTMLTAAGMQDALVMKLSAATGSVLWAQQLGDTGNAQVNAVALDPRNQNPLGASAVAGQFTNLINVGGSAPVKGNTMGAMMFDLFFARLAP